MDESNLLSMMRNQSLPKEFLTDEVKAFLKGKFTPGKTPYLHTVSFSDGSRIALRFTNTIRYMLDSKLQRRTDRQSHLSYMELCVFPFGMKAYTKVFEPKLVLIAAPVEKALAKHEANLQALKDIAADYDIDLESKESWSTVFDENYKK